MGRATCVLGFVGILLATAGLISRLLPVTHHITLVLAALSPYLMAFAPLAVVLLAANRRWVATVSAAVLTMLAVGTQLPLVRAAAPVPNSAAVRVLTANVLEGHADAQELLDVATHRADLLVVEELTPALADRLAEIGISRQFPYQAIEPGEHGHGVGIWSRYRITRNVVIDSYELRMVSADVTVPGVDHDTIVLAVHLPGPLPQPIDGWRTELHQLPVTLSEIAGAARGAVIAAGDFNATYDMAPFRGLLTNGYADAAEQSGSGLVRTFPADSSLPPLVGIDHILTFRSTATDIAAVRIPGSDHLGVLATVRIPTRP